MREEQIVRDVHRNKRDILKSDNALKAKAHNTYTYMHVVYA